MKKIALIILLSFYNQLIPQNLNMPVCLGDTNPLNINSGREVIIEGSGQMVYFSSQKKEPLIFLTNSSTAIFQNIMFENFDPVYISIQSGSKTSFSNCYLFWSINQHQSQEKLNLELENSTLDAQGQAIRLTNKNSLKISGNLTIKNTTLDIINAKALQLEESANLTLLNSKICLKCKNFTIAQGSIVIRGKSKIFSNQNTTLNFESSGKIEILPKAKLTIGPNLNFNYSPPKNTEANHFILNPKATLSLNQTTLTTNDHGFKFEEGTIEVRNMVTFNSTTQTFNEKSSWKIGNNCLVSITGSGHLKNCVSLIT